MPVSTLGLGEGLHANLVSYPETATVREDVGVAEEPCNLRPSKYYHYLDLATQRCLPQSLPAHPRNTESRCDDRLKDCHC